VAHGATSEARASFLVEALLVVRTVARDVSLLAAVEAVGEGVLLLLALLVGVVLRAALVAEPALGGRALAEQVLPGTTFQASLLVPLGVLQLSHVLLLPGQLLLDPFVLVLVDAVSLSLRVHHAILRVIERLL
jgi:hypothetical protein